MYNLGNMDGKKKTIDSFVGTNGGRRLTFEVVDSVESKQEVRSKRVFKRAPEDSVEARNKNLLDLSGVVRLPARNGNELEIETPSGRKESFYGSDRFTKAANEELMDDEEADHMEELGRKGALDFLNEDEDLLTDSRDQEDETRDDELSGAVARGSERRSADDEEGFEMGIEDGSGKKVLWQVITVVGIIVTIVLVSYVLFRIFYSAPEPASVGDGETSAQVTDDDGSDKADDQKPDEEPAVVEEVTASVAIYNAGTVNGAAARLAERLITLGMQAEAIDNLTYSGSGYEVLDLTGVKPQAADKLASELGTKATKVSAEDLPSGVVIDRDFVVIICD